MKEQFGLFLETNTLHMKNFSSFYVEEPRRNRDSVKFSVRFLNS